MKRFLFGLLLTCFATAVQADLLVYESFGDATEGQDLTGYSGTPGTTEIGLTGTWTSNQDTVIVKLLARGVSGNFEPGITEGYSPDAFNDSQHWLEQQDAWNTTNASRPLSSNIDLTVDGTYYLSLFTRTGGDDVTTQIGFQNSAKELLIGNGYNRGLTSYYGNVNANANDTNNNGTRYTVANWWKSVFWVFKIVKSDSGVTDTIDVNMIYYDLGANSVIDDMDPAVWTRTMTLTGVSAVFDNLRLKLDGGGGQWPGIDEIRIGETWSDVTGVVPPKFLPIEPTAGEIDVLLDQDLSWSIEDTNVEYVNLYFGTEDEPNLFLTEYLLLSHVPATEMMSFEPGTLDYETTYYWTVDTYEPVDSGGELRTGGKVYSFTTIAQQATASPVSPAKSAVEAGSDAVISVVGVNTDTYQWYKVGTPDVALSDGDDYSGTTTDTLTVLNVQLDDEGSYYCQVDNAQTEPTNSVPGLVMTRRLIVHYPLDEVAGNITPDVVGGFDMELISAPGEPGDSLDYPTLVTGKVGSGALLFNNSDSTDPNNAWGQYASAGDVDVEDMGTGLTIEFWVNFAGTNGDWQGVIDRRSAWASDQMTWQIAQDINGGGLEFTREGVGGVGRALLVEGQWHHIAATFDEESGDIRMYLDGELNSTNTGFSYGSGVDAPLKLACSNFSEETGESGQYFNGTLDDIQIYNYARNTDQIAQDYLAVNGGWVCDNEGTDDLTLDLDDNCQVDIADFAVMAAAWMNSNRIYPIQP